MHEHRTEISLVTLFQQGFTTYSYIDFCYHCFHHLIELVEKEALPNSHGYIIDIKHLHTRILREKCVGGKKAK